MDIIQSIIIKAIRSELTRQSRYLPAQPKVRFRVPDKLDAIIEGKVALDELAKAIGEKLEHFAVMVVCELFPNQPIRINGIEVQPAVDTIIEDEVEITLSTRAQLCKGVMYIVNPDGSKTEIGRTSDTQLPKDFNG